MIRGFGMGFMNTGIPPLRSVYPCHMMLLGFI
jgi:hypothetical protein